MLLVAALVGLVLIVEMGVVVRLAQTVMGVFVDQGTVAPVEMRVVGLAQVVVEMVVVGFVGLVRRLAEERKLVLEMGVVLGFG